MIIGYAKRRGGRPMQFEIGVLGVYDPLRDGRRDIKELSQWYSGLLEDIIRTAPDQYWWLHRRWKERKSPKLRRDAGQAKGVAKHVHSAPPQAKSA